MNQLVAIGPYALPSLIAVAGERASPRFPEFFTANIRNPHTRRAYGEPISRLVRERRRAVDRRSRTGAIATWIEDGCASTCLDAPRAALRSPARRGEPR
jgi:hypothetical protein